jgi:RND superfamily putative drug exporter
MAPKGEVAVPNSAYNRSMNFEAPLYRLNERGNATVELATLGRLGRWAADHLTLVAIGWLAVFISLGALAPRADHALSGAGWKALGSDSVEARELIDRHFGGLGSYSLAVVVAGQTQTVDDRAFRATLGRVRTKLDGDPAVGPVVGAGESGSISGDRRVAIVRAGAAAGDTEMVNAAERLAGSLEHLGSDGIEVTLTGTPALWADFNEANKAAMLKSEVLSWPVTLAILLVAFGSLVAAALPLLLAILGLICAAGALWLSAQFGDVTIWAMNFALMFALAVGIDYALFIVVRFRAALRTGLEPRDAAGVALDTAGKAVLISGLTVIASLAAVMIVPSPPFRTGALGILLAVSFVLAASLTLLPALLARLGSRIDRVALPWGNALEHRSEWFARWGRLLWRRPIALGGAALGILTLLMVPLLDLKTEMPSLGAVPEDAGSRLGYERIQEAFGPGAASELQVVVPEPDARASRAALLERPDIAAVTGPERSDGMALLRATPVVGPDHLNGLVEGVRASLPSGALVGGSAVESADLATTLDDWTPRLYGLVLGIGFVLLLVILRAPIVAAVSVLLSLLATAAAFGAAKLLFQDGHGEALFGFTSQGFLDAWGPVFFFALIFALAMDYTVFLLASVRERFERSGDVREAVVGGLADSGRPINAAAAVMVFVFLTFSLSGPLPPKEMGVILGIAVLLDATLVRLLLLPASLRLLGPLAWRIPNRVDRWLPRVRLDHSDLMNVGVEAQVGLGESRSGPR